MNPADNIVHLAGPSDNCSSIDDFRLVSVR